MFRNATRRHIHAKVHMYVKNLILAYFNDFITETNILPTVNCSYSIEYINIHINKTTETNCMIPSHLNIETQMILTNKKNVKSAVIVILFSETLFEF